MPVIFIKMCFFIEFTLFSKGYGNIYEPLEKDTISPGCIRMGGFMKLTTLQQANEVLFEDRIEILAAWVLHEKLKKTTLLEILFKIYSNGHWTMSGHFSSARNKKDGQLWIRCTLALIEAWTLCLQLFYKNGIIFMSIHFLCLGNCWTSWNQTTKEFLNFWH